MKHLAIIPARGGSKRLPRKNLLPLGGKPLVAHTLEAATGSGLFETVLLSSDDPEILAVGAGVPGHVAGVGGFRFPSLTALAIRLSLYLTPRPQRFYRRLGSVCEGTEV